MSESANIKNTAQPAKAEKKENLLLNLAFNIVIPAVILSKFSGDAHLGSTWGLVVALAFPLVYGLTDFFQRGKVNVFSIIGIISTLLTGGISLLELDPKYIAIKEAMVPGIIGLVVLVSTWTPYPLIEKLIFNDSIFDIEKLNRIIASKGAELEIKRVLTNSSYITAASFALSSLLNYGLAVYIVVSPAGTEAYNEELGKMIALSWPVIALPSMVVMGCALFYLIHHLQKITGESLENFMVGGEKIAEAKQADQ